MTKNNNPEYKFWNGKNPEGGSTVGNRELIQPGPRDSKTAAKYQVGNDTVAADNLQQKPR